MPAAFVRHYEDAARLIEGRAKLKARAIVEQLQMENAGPVADETEVDPFA